MMITRAKAEAVRKKHESDWLKIDEVVMVTVRQEPGEDAYILIGVHGDLKVVREQIPEEIDGVEIILEERGKIIAFAKAEEVLERHRQAWHTIDDVIGTCTQEDDEGKPTIYINITGDPQVIQEQILKQLKDEDLEGVKIVLEDTGGIEFAVLP